MRQICSLCKKDSLFLIRYSRSCPHSHQTVHLLCKQLVALPDSMIDGISMCSSVCFAFAFSDKPRGRLRLKKTSGLIAGGGNEVRLTQADARVQNVLFLQEQIKGIIIIDKPCKPPRRLTELAFFHFNRCPRLFDPQTPYFTTVSPHLY